MNNIGVIGIGNCGNQNAALAKEILACDSLAINVSETDLSSLPAEMRPYAITIGDGRGSGKDRIRAKKALRDDLIKVINSEQMQQFLSTKDIIFVISSSGGGSGGGSAIMFTDILMSKIADTDIPEDDKAVVITIGVLPYMEEGDDYLKNSLQYIKELYECIDDPTYMIYTNEAASNLKQLDKIYAKVNRNIIDDIKVLSGAFNTQTSLSSIDDQDFKNMIRTFGRIVVSNVTGITTDTVDRMTIEDQIIKDLKLNAHVDIQQDRKVSRIGIISDLPESIHAGIDFTFPKIREYVGRPNGTFIHDIVGDDKGVGEIHMIFTGLNPINDATLDIDTTLTEHGNQKGKKEDSIIGSIDISSYNDEDTVRTRNTSSYSFDETPSAESGETPKPKTDLKDTFAKFGI